MGHANSAARLRCSGPARPDADYRKSLPKRRLSRLQLALRLQYVAEQALGIGFGTWIMHARAKSRISLALSASWAILPRLRRVDVLTRRIRTRALLAPSGYPRAPERRGQRIAVLGAGPTAPVAVQLLQLDGAAFWIAHIKW